MFDSVIDTEEMLNTLRTRGYDMNDVEQWAWVISGDGPDAMMERFLSKPERRPNFLFLQILRLEILKVRTLKMALVFIWDKVLGRTRETITSLNDVEVDAAIPWSDVAKLPTHASIQFMESDGPSFMVLIGRLLSQARRIWHPSILSIIHLFGAFVSAFLREKDCDPKMLDPATHQSLCKFYNDVINLVKLPASMEPLKSMVHNRRAHTVLLTQSEELFEPSLLLDERSYRAIIQVLNACQKTEKETKTATLRSNSWPPWREAQDGMDAQSIPEESTSRVVLALGLKAASGFNNNNPQDRALSILGGQERDGTPTIHTRRLLKRRTRSLWKPRSPEPGTNSTLEWTARIEATRNIREAWSAFLAHQELGLRPSQSMYFAMFVKIVYYTARIQGRVRSPQVPGNGREVFPVPDDNFSSSYKHRYQAPPLDELYRRMLEDGIRPSGQCLLFLVERAGSIAQGLAYLRDSKALDKRAMACMDGNHTVPAISEPGSAVENISPPLFAAFIALLCRFAPRAIWRTTPKEDLNMNFGVSSTEGEAFETRLFIIEDRRSGMNTNPLLHAAELLRWRQTTFRPAWYSLFYALARRGAIVSRDLAGHSMNDILAWRVLAVALRDFHRCGLELDPRGFLRICDGFRKGIEASAQVDDHNDEVLRSLPLLKEEFRQISETTDGRYHFPKLLHTIHGAHLHAYVRAVGLAGDYDEILWVLNWMVKYHEELDFISQQSRNGPKQIRKLLCVTKAFLGGTDYEDNARKLVDSIEIWDGWPDDYEVERYQERWSGQQPYDVDDQD